MRSLWRAATARSNRLRACPRLEQLESRLTPYSLSGNAWPSPQLITLSFMPDGTPTNGGVTPSNLFAVFSRFGAPSVWQKEMLRGAQVWAEQTNINFAVVSDNGTTLGAGAYQQGDPGMGDIRIGGYNYGSGSTWLASAFMPPPINNFSLAGDNLYNTGKGFNIGYTYDLFSVAAHEIGHSLGLYHSNTAASVLWPSYNGLKMQLAVDDVNGIRAIYGGPRVQDAYDAAASNNSFATASNITSTIDTGSLTALVTGLDLTTRTDTDFYTFTAPAGTTGTLTLHVQSQGLSLLSPKVTVYAADQTTILGTATGFGDYDGSTLSVTINGVTEGTQYYVKVQGAEPTPPPWKSQTPLAFNTGTYALTLNFGTNPDPTVPLPITTLPNGIPFSAGGGQPQTPDDHDHGDEGGSDSFPGGTDPSSGRDLVALVTPSPVTGPIAGTSTSFAEPADAAISDTTLLSAAGKAESGKWAFSTTTAGADDHDELEPVTVDGTNTSAPKAERGAAADQDTPVAPAEGQQTAPDAGAETAVTPSGAEVTDQGDRVAGLDALFAEIGQLVGDLAGSSLSTEAHPASDLSLPASAVAAAAILAGNPGTAAGARAVRPGRQRKGI